MLPALAPLAGEVCFDLSREDQERASALLLAGTVMAAVIARAAPVPGCSSTRLGGMHYRPMATPLIRPSPSPSTRLGHGPRRASRDVTAELVVLDPSAEVGVVLYWQRWELRSPTLDRVREAVLEAAGHELDQRVSAR